MCATGSHVNLLKLMLTAPANHVYCFWRDVTSHGLATCDWWPRLTNQSAPLAAKLLTPNSSTLVFPPLVSSPQRNGGEIRSFHRAGDVFRRGGHTPDSGSAPLTVRGFITKLTGATRRSYRYGSTWLPPPPSVSLRCVVVFLFFFSFFFLNFLTCTNVARLSRKPRHVWEIPLGEYLYC